MSPATPIAVVGMGGLFPGALDPERLWAEICARREAVADVPRSRWIAAPAQMIAPVLEPDKAFHTRCCLLPEFGFDPAGWEIDPELLSRLDPLYHVLLTAGRQALGGAAAPRLNRERTGVILAALVLPTDASSALTRELLGARIASGRPESPVALDPAHGVAARVAGLPAGLLAKALGLKAGSLTLDAACASSLYAIKLACDELASGRADAILAGGVSRPDCLFTQVGFSQLRALSPSGCCAPFDRSADGLIVGEGAGILVLKRLADARADADTILGLVRGIGLSNDLRGNLLAPDSEGQLRAMRAACEAAGVPPQAVDYIECHGAGTPVGDAVELESLRQLWGESGWAPGQCAIGSVKSMIGHLLTAAGAAAVIRTLLAFRHATLPPTLNFREAPEKSPLNGGPFRIPTTAEPWERRTPDTPRRAAVSAFGFGGINAHLLLEEWAAESEAGAVRSPQSVPGLDLPETGPRRIPLSTADAAPTRREPGIDRSPHPVAIVGMAACLGSAGSLAEFEAAVLGATSLIAARPPARWKACDELLPPLAGLRGGFMDAFDLAPGRFRIPPREIPDILPQQLLMLNVAAEALRDAGLDLRGERPRMGAVIGIDFDFDATNFHLRWLLRQHFAERGEVTAPGPDSHESCEWLARAQDACSPPLTASRVLGALGSMVASRMAREFRFGGPSFTISAGAASGLRALAAAVRALQADELEALLVGAVDLCGDLRAVALNQARHPFSPAGRLAPFDPAADGTLPGEGAVALVLKRLDRALAEGDRVVAVVRGIGAAGGGGIDAGRPSPEAYLRSLSQAVREAGAGPADIGLIEAHGSGVPVEDALEQEVLARWAGSTAGLPRPESVKKICGHTGAASGLASVLKAALCLHHELVPPRAPADASTRDRPPEPQRLALTACLTDDGNCMHVVLANGPPPADPPKPRAPQAPLMPSAAAPIRIPVAGAPLIVPPPPEPAARAADAPPAAPAPRGMAAATDTGLINGLARTTQATARAHQAFLDFTSEATRRLADGLRVQAGLLSAAGGGKAGGPPPLDAHPRPAFDRDQCLEFARGSAARVLGPEFAEVDSFAARVRLPDEPLMLVDRILEIHGAKGGLGPGRVVTEHDVLPGAWYLDGDRAPVCISVEAGQADLFLCAFLGIDKVVRGRRTYRLLDATVEFHRDLPRPGETIRYDIEIEKFLRQGETYLFLFHFRGTINGAPLITMTEGCAGFFTPEEVDRSGGILLTEEERRPKAGKRPSAWTDPVPLAPGAYDEEALGALRRGDAAACFGEAFAGARLPAPLRLPGGRMKLIDRITEFDPAGGRYGLGRIRAEADIRPDAWFLTCHFVDDMVMPGTLMYECCAQALRVLVQRLGWVTDRPGARYEPLPGRRAALKCRGPVTPRTRRVVYQVEVQELGYGPEPYAVADADMLADGRHIVRFTGMSLRLAGATRADIESFWGRRPRPAPTARRAAPGSAVYPRAHLLEFARGLPSRAFGEPYRPFDTGRFIARLPSPPYLFIDRITSVEPPPWEVRPGGWVEAEVDIPPDAWHIRAERSRTVPYCVLLEAALQPCGWLAAYMGSALKSDKPLHFRNLGGEATLYRAVGPAAGTLTVRTRMRHVSEVRDMIIEHFDFEISNREGRIYAGTTYFGFFTPAALERQEGIRDGAALALTPPPGTPSPNTGIRLSDEAPLSPEDPDDADARGLALPAKALRMIDRIDLFLPDAGPAGLGLVRGTKEVDPQEWFFKAHFFQDPVCPGSLGIESFLQLLKFAARERWPQLSDSHRFAPATGVAHRWTYRGQILPRNRTVTVEAAITRVVQAPDPALYAAGSLSVDGLCIYRMEEFGVALVPGEGSTE